MDRDTQIITSEFHEILGAFDQINDCILVIDPATESIINANKSACGLYGYSKEEFVKLKIPDISKEYTNAFRSRLYRVISEETSKTFELSQRAKDGSPILLEISPSLVTYNNRTAIFCAGRDISERKTIEDKLRKSEEHFRLLVEGLNVVTWTYDVERKTYLYISPYCETVVGYPSSKWYGGDYWFDIIHPDDKEYVERFAEENIKLRRDYDIEYRIITQDEEVKWLRDITTVHVENDKVRTLTGVLVDVTERRLTEEALSESREQLYQVFENAPIGKTLTTIDGRLLQVNKAFCELVGYSREELHKLDFQTLTHPDDLHRNMEILDKAIADGKNTCKIEKRYIRKDGTSVLAETNVSILRDDKGRPIRYIAQVVDISKLKEDQDRLRETEHRLSSLLNNLSNIVFYESDDKGVFVSENIFEMTGYNAKEFETDRDLFEKLIHHDDAERLNSQIKSWRAAENTSSLNFEFRLKKKDDTYIWVEDHMFGIKSPYKFYWSGFLIDMTERKLTQIKLEETQKRLATVLNNLPNIVFYESEDDRVFISDNIERLLGYTAEEIENDKLLFPGLVHPADMPDKKTAKELLNKNKYLKQEIRVRRKSGEYVWIEDHMYQVDSAGKSYAVGFMMDITDRKVTEQRLEETQMRLAAVLNNLPNVVFYENAFRKQFISENIMEMLGYPVEEFYQNADLFDSLIHPDDIDRVVMKSDEWFRTGARGTYRELFRIKRKDGRYIWLEDHMFRSQRLDEQYYYSGVMIDITERKMIEDQVEQSLKEKELLIKEIHHRVKNNLQVVSSLLKLQSVHVKDRETLDMLIDSQNRVQSMALVHQKLYQSKDLANINLSEYVGQLLFHIQNSVRPGDSRVSFRVDVQNITMGVDTAVPCGLIINELVTNSLKHGFPGNSPGQIRVSLDRKSKDIYEMIIEDDGLGFPEDLDFKNSPSLGLQLVNTLVSQLEGDIQLVSGKGTKFIITFHESEIM